ncbi:CoA-binding protein [Caldibacillus debilis]|jgi:predicted CoA-binding protein|uniref:Putative CoA-binding protein n=1 Tax=Caldibacillus debilis GB1 TaxID=1339248 RepID=A0A420VK39_9BACI|nr:putative CoA-binding protein [Caldibacillus debilis GB1]
MIENPPLEEIAKILRRAKRIAVVGLSDKPDRTSYQIAKEMQNLGYEIIPVNPMIDEALGVKAVSSLKEIEGHVDIVNIFRRSEYLMEIAKEFVEIDADVFWAQQGIADEETYRFLKERGVTVIMDRCIKVMHSLTKNMPLTGE